MSMAKIPEDGTVKTFTMAAPGHDPLGDMEPLLMEVCVGIDENTGDGRLSISYYDGKSKTSMRGISCIITPAHLGKLSYALTKALEQRRGA